MDELFAKLYGGKQFTNLDLSSACNQLLLDEESQMLTCINTHNLYKYNRLFGFNFSKDARKYISRHRWSVTVLDDILITGETKRN